MKKFHQIQTENFSKYQTFLRTPLKKD